MGGNYCTTRAVTSIQFDLTIEIVRKLRYRNPDIEFDFPMNKPNAVEKCKKKGKTLRGTTLKWTPKSLGTVFMITGAAHRSKSAVSR